MAPRTPVAETTAEAPEEEKPAEETPPESPAEEGLSSAIKQYVEEAVDKAVAGFKELTGKGEGKRRTYRDEEDEMNELVGSKVKELLDAERIAGEKHPEPKADDKAAPEPIPAQPAGRRIEKLMGWS